MDEPNIISVDYSEQATLFESEPGGRLRQWLRRALRRWGLMKPQPSLNLFQANMGAFRFLTDDGRVCIVPVTRELIDDASIDAEAFAREMAIPKLRELSE